MYATRKQKLACGISCLIVLMLLNGCRTVPTVVPYTGTGANQVRTDIADLQNGQTETAITGTNIENGSNQIASGLDNIEQAIISGTDADADFEAILRAVRKRPLE